MDGALQATHAANQFSLNPFVQYGKAPAQKQSVAPAKGPSLTPTQSPTPSGDVTVASTFVNPPSSKHC